MTDKELIKKEIERRITISLEQGYTYSAAQLKRIIDFINSLPEEPASEDLEEELDNFLKDPVFGKLINRNAGIALASHFADWQRKKDQQTIELAEDHAMLAGMEKMRDEMMKDAVDATVYKGLYSKYIKERDYESLSKALENFEERDRVKIIIVRED